MRPASGGPPDGDSSSAAFNVTVSTIAGKLDDRGNAEDGNGANARFWNPTKMVYDNRNNILYVADGTVIRSIDMQNNVKTYIPLGAIGSSYNEILDMDVAPGTGGTLYIVTKENDLWKIEPNGNVGKATNIVNRVYGGNAVGALNSGDHFDLPNGLATGANGQVYFFNEPWSTIHRITFTSPSTGKVELFAGKALTERGGNGNPYPFRDGRGEEATFGSRVSDMAADGNGNIYVADLDNELVRKVASDGTVSSLFQYKNKIGVDIDGPVATAQSNNVTQVTSNQDGSYIFFTTFGNAANNLSALRLVRPGKDVTTLVGYGYSGNYGDGTGKTAGLGQIGGIASTPDGKTIYISEPGRKVIRKVVLH
ncbi:hypothetical protein [Segetibacter koreensis]|uniref:hypothetical protein n=1 Tax=Segetibacter koreensis TaxID=398037 RepID=UPI0003778A96|nr:hypothetical protein [Segetibacter koreensis]